MKRSKAARQQELREHIAKSPFSTDEELARRFSVSIQTIRLDRMELGIPELRKRVESVAEGNLSTIVRSLSLEEVVGDIVDVEPDRYAVSVFDVGQQHVFKRNGIARGHHIFAQANSLAVAVIDDPLALTAKSALTFVRPVRAGERIVCKATVTDRDRAGHRTTVEVRSTVESEPVFTGSFVMYRTAEGERS